jgi:L-threonylcarbamoyladenylate synthase
MNNQIDEAVEILNKGGIIIFPTDTAFGIGCRIDNDAAIKKLFRIRNRPITQATPILVSGLEMAKKYAVDVPEDIIEKLINPFWPGALTIVLKANMDKVPLLVRGGTETVGLRMPGQQTILDIIKKVGVPILGPSANFHGGGTPFEIKDLDPELVTLVDYLVEGECSIKNSSTVIDCTKTPWKILRQGAIQVKI